MIIYDITKMLFPGMAVYPNDPVFRMRQVYSIEQDGYTLSEITLGSHTGTHLDAPCHCLPGKEGVDQIPLEYLIGPAKVIQIQTEVIHEEDIIDKGINRGDRILFKTQNSLLNDHEKFQEKYVYLSEDAARYLAEKKIKLIGTDYYSIDAYTCHDYTCHKILLEAQIPILEGLNLTDVPEGIYYLAALPLKILGCDGSPVRAVLLQDEPHYSERCSSPCVSIR